MKSSVQIVKSDALNLRDRGERLCKKCGVLFHGERCKQCLKAYREENKEAIKSRQSAYRAANAERYAVYFAEKYRANSDVYKQYSAEWRIKNPARLKASKEEYNSTHKEENRLYSASYRVLHAEKAKQSNLAYRLKNPIKVREKKLAYLERNLEKVVRYRASYKKKNAGKIKSWIDDYRKRNRDRIKAQRASNPYQRLMHKHNRRARLIGNGGVLSQGLVKKLLAAQKWKCACCGSSLMGGYHLDHIMPLAKGGANSDLNIQLLAPKCNLEKGAKHPVDFMQSRGFLL